MIRKCLKCQKDFEPIYEEHKFCPNCWDQIYRKTHPEKSTTHRYCLNCGADIDYQPEGFRYCQSCWIKRKKGKY